MSRIKKWWEAIRRGLKASAESERYTKTGRFIGEDPEFPNTYRPELKLPKHPKVKTLVASTLVATVMAATAQAQCGSQCEDYTAYNWFERAWGWVTSYFSTADVAQGLSTVNQTSPQGTANNWSYGIDQTGRRDGNAPGGKGPLENKYR